MDDPYDYTHRKYSAKSWKKSFSLMSMKKYGWTLCGVDDIKKVMYFKRPVDGLTVSSKEAGGINW